MTSEDFQDDLVEAQDDGAPGPVIADPPKSRFLFVDVAALRAKQLRRGALARLGREAHHPIKAERVAMEEVRKGLVGYDLPEFKARPAAEQ